VFKYDPGKSLNSWESYFFASGGAKKRATLEGILGTSYSIHTHYLTQAREE